MLVAEPHDLGRVDGAAAAQGDDDVGLVGDEALKALVDHRDRRIGLDLVEDRVGDPDLVQGLGHLLRQAELEQGLVRDDEGPLLPGELAQGEGKAAVLVVDLGRQAEPEHVLPPLGDGLHVQQVLRLYVFAHAVSSPAAAAEGQRRLQPEIVEIADRPLGARDADEDAARLHDVSVALDPVAVARRGVEHRGVAHAGELDEGPGLLHGVVEVPGLVEGENGGELLPGVGFVGPDLLDLGDEELGPRGGLDPGHLRDLRGALPDDVGADPAVLDEDPGELFLLLFGKDEGAPRGEALLHRVVDRGHRDRALLRGADHPVVEHLREDDGGYGRLDVGGLVDDGGGVARTDAESRVARCVGGLDHAGTAGGEDQVHARVLHQQPGELDGGIGEPADNAVGSPGLHRGLEDYPRRLDRAELRPGMG